MNGTPAFTLTPGKWHANLAPGFCSRDETAPGVRDAVQLIKQRDACERNARAFLDPLPDTVIRCIAFKMMTAAGECAMTCGTPGASPFFHGMKFALHWMLGEAGITTITGNTAPPTRRR